jgi:hypothetical protein
VVAHGDQAPAIPLLQGHIDGRAIGAVVQGVLQQVEQGLVQAAGIHQRQPRLVAPWAHH